MYAKLDVVGDAMRRAEKAALADRQRYAAFIEAGERFASETGLIVTGASATRMLLAEADSAPDINSFQYEFSSRSAPSASRALGRAVYEVDPGGVGKHTAVLTKIAGSLMAVAVDGRELFTVAALAAHRGVHTADVVVPVERPAMFAKDGNGRPISLLCIGPDLRLVDTYAALCSPARVSDWPGLLEIEPRLRASFLAEVRELIARVAAGRPLSAAAAAPAPSTDRLTAAVRSRFVESGGRVQVGAAAISALAGGQPPPGAERLQVVAAGRLEAEAAQVVAIAESVGVAVSWNIDDPKLPGEPRMRRLTVYRQPAGGRRIPFLDVFNAAEFEPVPFVVGKSGGRIGTPFAIMRFRLVDMWTIRVLERMGAVEPGFAGAVLRGMLAGFEMAAELVGKLTAAGAFETLLPTESYFGRLDPLELSLKRAAAAAGKIYPPYYPAEEAAATATGGDDEEDDYQCYFD